jgi:hypothetical protein
MPLLADRQIPPCGWIWQYTLIWHSESSLYVAEIVQRPYDTLGPNCLAIINQTYCLLSFPT